MTEIETDKTGNILSVSQLDYIQNEDELLSRLEYKIDIEEHSLIVDEECYYNNKRINPYRVYRDKKGCYILYTDDRDDFIVGFSIEMKEMEGEFVAVDNDRKPLKMDYTDEDLASKNKSKQYGHGIV